jgi:uncharacterized protein YabN with tetrapyrrole methylase and pyrophosphatase domain
MLERASKFGFNLDLVDSHQDEIREKWDLVIDFQSKEKEDLAAQAMGDLFFTLVKYTQKWGLNAEDVLRGANQHFLRRFERLEQDMKTSGMSLEEAPVKQLKKAWQKTEA